jgi:hypothetical protein
VNYSDPFGLKTLVNCRAVKTSKNHGHCAVRVVDKEKGIDVTVEMTPKEGSASAEAPFGTEQVTWTHGTPPSGYDGGWVELAAPEGRSSAEFDRAVLESAAREQGRIEGSAYTPGGASNSNRFVHDVIRGAGGRGRKEPAQKFILGAPGLCGGRGGRTGADCNP